MRLIKKSLMAFILMGSQFSMEKNPTQSLVNNYQDLEQQNHQTVEPLIPHQTRQEDCNLLQSAIPGKDIVDKLFGSIDGKTGLIIFTFFVTVFMAISYA